MTDSLFIQLKNVLDLNFQDEFEFIDGTTVRRAHDDEITKIRAASKWFGDIAPFVDLVKPYENEYELSPHSPGPGGVDIYLRRDLPPAEYRYTVVELAPTSTDDEMQDLITKIELASKLTELELTAAAHFRGESHGVNFFNHSSSSSKVQVLTTELCVDMANTAQSIDDLPEDGDFESIRRGLGMFDDLSHVPRQHPLHILGLFSVIECLLTHSPMNTHDSLSHQISTKVPLMARRMADPIDYSDLLETSESTVWKKMYVLRSRIAHGAQMDFGSKLAVLSDLDVATKFLRRATKKLLKQSLTEPQLTIDLAKC